MVGFWGEYYWMGFFYLYLDDNNTIPSGYVKIAIENGP